MKNKSYNFYPTVYRVIALIACMILVIIFNKSKAETSTSKYSPQQKETRNT